MEEVMMDVDGYDEQQIMPDAVPFARSYQLEALDKAIHENTIVYLETGSGKTLIAIMLLRSYAYHLRKPSPYIAVFLVPKVVLVEQQANALRNHTDLKVGMFWGDMGVDCWDGDMWKGEMEKHEVLVMTPAILLSCLRHSFIKLKMIKVLIMDECHHAAGKHPYACIMTEFYHHQLRSGITELPRIFGMTASPIKSKAANSEATLSKDIRKLMTLMHSKVYTCVSDAVISQFIPMSTPKFRYYMDSVISDSLFKELAKKLDALKQQHELDVTNSDFTKSAVESAHKKLSKIFNASLFCLEELGVWFALKAVESLSSIEIETFKWGNSGDQIVKNFVSATTLTLQSHVPSDPQWTIGDDMNSDVEIGLLTSKVSCLIDCLLEYKDLTEMRCIVFVERVIAAMVLEVLLNTVLPKYNSWRTNYIAGNGSKLQNQSRKSQNEIVDEFRMGLVNVIVATSILEEGLDVQSCNLVIRFDPSPTVCSFVQSRGRARMQNSDYILMVKSGDSVTHSRLEKYLAGGEMMRKKSLHYSSLPCERLESDQFHDQTYRVATTEAVVNLSSSITLIYLYCSRLPSDGYFKPTPRWDKQKGILYLPKSCPIQPIHVQGDTKFLKNIACLEACKQLHNIGALTDYLVPSIVVEEAEVEEFGNEPYDEEQPSYIPSELVNHVSNSSNTIYYCYLIEIKQNFSYDINVQDIFLATRVKLDPEIGCMQFDMCFDKGSLSVKLKYKGSIKLSSDQVLLCKRFQVNVLGILMKYKTDKETLLDKCCLEDDLEIDYLLLPSIVIDETPAVDWLTIKSVHPSKIGCQHHETTIWTANGLVCGCILRNALVCTPHNGRTYITTNIMELDGNSPLEVGDGEVTTYKKYFGQKHGIRLHFEHQRLLKARHVFPVKNYCHGRRQAKERDVSNTFVELPPELCSIIMSPISIDTLYSFLFIPSIMHRLESLLVAFNFKKMHLDHCPQNRIQTSKILEAMTTKSCKETFHCKSLATLGDSFLKYAVSQQLFSTYQNHHEGLLSVKRKKIICNAALCKLGCGSRIPGFIRNEPFDPKTWTIPGYKSSGFKLEETVFKGTKIYTSGNKKLKRKVVADVVEALIGAFLSTGGETAALLFMDWIGIKVNFNIALYERQFCTCPENIVNVVLLESLLKYSFRDRSLLVEAMTHGSYMLPDVPRCYQRLEYLGDSVLDYLITMHMYTKYPGMSPRQLTDMRAASVNNDCYARSAIKVHLHKHVLHTSQELHKHIVATLCKYDELSSSSTFGWESEASFPKVLGDIIESLAGAILVDSGYNKEIVWQSIRPLLEPLVTPDTLTVHPIRELTELCPKMKYTMDKTLSRNDGVTSCKIEVIVDGVVHQHEYKGSTNKKTATRLACKGVLNSLRLKETQDK
ncbi:endoribonuclease Dicer homolog 2-like [Trifolium pratense]|nr:endoribonuclease Dicer homolog 2-like [Trifolium pratense]XP_045805846.1 endoribonuclease Dicer homolog 2-like [Trifolium pratense]XP_045805852.1 endoribonuclease Dicer homolog 2-like [Trifolium pratense]XP_045805861.1 endoribonuclease Dicer homolog 2-like [Trifolium pratense]